MNIGSMCHTIHIKHVCVLENRRLMTFREIVSGNVCASLKEPLKPNPAPFCLVLKLFSPGLLVFSQDHNIGRSLLSQNWNQRLGKAQGQFRKEKTRDEEPAFICNVNIVESRKSRRIFTLTFRVIPISLQIPSERSHKLPLIRLLIPGGEAMQTQCAKFTCEALSLLPAASLRANNLPLLLSSARQRAHTGPRS